MKYEYAGKSYEELLSDALADEATADSMYLYMASLLDQQGDPEAAEILKSIAADEQKHYRMLSFLYSRRHPEEPLKPAYRMRGAEMTRHSPGRAFPRTYGEWVILAEDLKAKRPEDADFRSEVNHHLSVLGGMAEGDQDDSKRWLAEKAAELGVS